MTGWVMGGATRFSRPRHYLGEFPFAKISTPAMIDFTKFFPKQFYRKFFPGLSQKIFPAHAMNARFAIFQNPASHLS
jgi:hypothetical protein